MFNKIIFTIAVLGLFGTLTYAGINKDSVLGATTVVMPSQGGTGTSTKPTYGQLLMGTASGTYDLVATSSLNIVGSRWTLSGSDIYYATGNVEARNSFLSDTITSYNTATNLSLSAKTAGYSVLLNPTNATGKVGILTSTPGFTLDVNGEAAIRNNLFAYGDIKTTNSEFYYNSSTAQTQIVSLLTGNMNFPDNGGRLGFGNMYVSTTAGTQMEIGAFGFNGDYLMSAYTEAAGGFGYKANSTWINFFPFLPYGNVSSTGNGESKTVTTTVTYTTATTTIFSFAIDSTTTMFINAEVLGTNQSTGTTTLWHADILAKRWNNVITIPTTTVDTYYQDNTAVTVFTSTTASGFNINVVGDTTSTWKADLEVHVISP